MHTTRLVLFGLCLAANAESGLPPKYKALPDFRVPDEFRKVQDFHPIGYLEDYPVANVSAKLPPVLRESLRKLFIAAHDATQEKYQQDYLIDVNCPIVKLLRSNYPEIDQLLRNRAQVTLLGTITDRLKEPSDPSPPKAPAPR